MTPLPCIRYHTVTFYFFGDKLLKRKKKTLGRCPKNPCRGGDGSRVISKSLLIIAYVNIRDIPVTDPLWHFMLHCKDHHSAKWEWEEDRKEWNGKGVKRLWLATMDRVHVETSVAILVCQCAFSVLWWENSVTHNRGEESSKDKYTFVFCLIGTSLISTI